MLTSVSSLNINTTSKYLKQTKAVFNHAVNFGKLERNPMAGMKMKSKEAEKLKEQLGESKNYASVKAVESKVGGKYNWRELKKWCVANGKKIKDIADANYGTVKIYHKDAWNAVYGIKLIDLFSS